MSRKSSKFNQDLTEQAAKWLVLLNDQPLDAQQHARFNEWIAANPKHQETFERLRKLVEDVGEVSEYCHDHKIAKHIINESLHVQQPLLKQLKKSLWVVAFFCVGISMIAWVYRPATYWLADIHSGSQSWQQTTLSDQSQIQLAGKSAINIHYNSKLRRIELLQGNLLVDVAKDPQRPLLVETRHGHVQALGTRFIVSQNGHKTIITMLNSRTSVWSSVEPNQKVEIIQGERLELDSNGLLSRQPIVIDAAMLDEAWQQRRLMVNGERLVDILDYLAMFSDAKISFDRQALAHKRVTASLALDDVEASLQQLATELGLTIQHSFPSRIRIYEK